MSKRCLPMPQRYVTQVRDDRTRIGNLERKEPCEGFQKGDVWEVIPDENLLAYYRFEEESGDDFADSTGNGNTLTSGGVTDNYVHAVDGHAQKALKQNTSAQKVEFGDPRPKWPHYSSGIVGTSAGSFMFFGWFKPEPSVFADWVPLMGQGSGETASFCEEASLWYKPSTGKVGLLFGKIALGFAHTQGAPSNMEGLGMMKESATSLQDDEFNFVAWVHDDGANEDHLYVRSGKVIDATYASTDGGAVAIEDFFVGLHQWSDHFTAQFAGGDEWRVFYGAHDEVGVWSGLPTAGNVQAIHDAARSVLDNQGYNTTSGHPVARIRVKKNGV